MVLLSKVFSRSRPLFTLFRGPYRKPSTPWRQMAKSTGHRKRLWLVNAGIMGVVFAVCFLAIPFYQLVCQTTGLIGDNEQKNFRDRSDQVSKEFVHRKFTIAFEADVEPELGWDFYPQQQELVINAAEPAMMFYKAKNLLNKPKVGIALYTVFPEEASYYFSKIQCFCFDQQALAGKEVLDMPLFFFIEPEILDDYGLKDCRKIKIIYKFYEAINQDIAKWMQKQEIMEFEQKHFLREKRRQKMIESGQDTSEMDLEDANDLAIIQTHTPEYVPGMLTMTELAEQLKE